MSAIWPLSLIMSVKLHNGVNCLRLIGVLHLRIVFFFFFQAEDGIRDYKVTGVQTCALPISGAQVRLLLADGLALPLVRHRALRETAGLGEEVLAPAAEPFRELRPLERPEIGDGPDVTLVQEALGLGSDPRNDPDPQRIEKRLDLLRSHDREPVGLLKIGGDLGDELVGAYAYRGGQPFLAHDLRLEPAGALDRSVEAAERRELEIRLVGAGLLEGLDGGVEGVHVHVRDDPQRASRGHQIAQGRRLVEDNGLWLPRKFLANESKNTLNESVTKRINIT